MQRKSISIISLLLAASLVAMILYSIDVPNPFGVMKADRTLTKQELIRAIRLMVTAEYEAVQLYTQVAESTDDELAKKVLINIANEERVHAGEFLRLLKHLDPEEEKHYKEGSTEVEEEIKKLEEKKIPKI